jgi:hypothetical protein
VRTGADISKKQIPTATLNQFDHNSGKEEKCKYMPSIGKKKMLNVNTSFVFCRGILSEYTKSAWKLEVGTSILSRAIKEDGGTLKTDSKFPVDAGFVYDKAHGIFRFQGQ